jgi:hypothetical protein
MEEPRASRPVSDTAGGSVLMVVAVVGVVCRENRPPSASMRSLSPTRPVPRVRSAPPRPLSWMRYGDADRAGRRPGGAGSGRRSSAAGPPRRASATPAPRDHDGGTGACAGARNPARAAAGAAGEEVGGLQHGVDQPARRRRRESEGQRAPRRRHLGGAHQAGVGSAASRAAVRRVISTSSRAVTTTVRAGASAELMSPSSVVRRFASASIRTPR